MSFESEANRYVRKEKYFKMDEKDFAKNKYMQVLEAAFRRMERGSNRISSDNLILVLDTRISHARNTRNS